MGDPSRNAGGTPDDWASGSKKPGCDKIFGLIVLVGTVSAAQLVSYAYLIGQAIT